MQPSKKKKAGKKPKKPDKKEYIFYIRGAPRTKAAQMLDYTPRNSKKEHLAKSGETTDFINNLILLAGFDLKFSNRRSEGAFCIIMAKNYKEKRAARFLVNLASITENPECKREYPKDEEIFWRGKQERLVNFRARIILMRTEERRKTPAQRRANRPPDISPPEKSPASPPEGQERPGNGENDFFGRFF